MKKVKLAIIIPCLNEKHHLLRTLPSLAEYMKQFKYDYEILLIDNGSSDGSPELARSFGITTLIKPKYTISMLRNFGVSTQSADFLAFLDADVEITNEWTKTLSNFIETTSENALIITGAPYLRPPKSSLLERHWFNAKEFSENALNGGNLITTRSLFAKVGGFDPRMITGEDWDFCSRAKTNGAVLNIDYCFEVYHHGFPKTLSQFFRRELWHGLGDFVSFKSFIKSKPALLAVSVGLLLLLAVSKTLVSHDLVPTLFYFLLLFFLALVISIRRSAETWQIPGNTVLAIVYLYARLGSFLKMIVTRLHRSQSSA